MEKLHPGAKWKFRVESYLGMIFIVPLLVSLFISSDWNLGALDGILLFSLVFIIIYILITEIFVRWGYSNWKYELTQDSLKIEKGVIIKKYKSIPYERVQNVDITRGIIARIIGFSTIDIQTAGYSAYAAKGGMGQSEGHLPALSIEVAEKIREFLMKKITGKKQGL